MPPHQTYQTWPARYKASTIEIHEAAGHHHWIASREVRDVLPSLRTDAQLSKDYPHGFEKRDKGARLFFSETALTSELRRMGGKEALMFLAWLDKTVYYPASRKRDGAPALKVMPTKLPVAGETEEDADSLHISPRKLPPMPRTARVAPMVLLPDQKGALDRLTLAPILAIWRGDLELTRTMVSGGLALVGWVVTVSWLIATITAPSRYNGSFVIKQWLVLLLILSIGAGLVWWCVGIMRCALRRHREGSSFTGSLAAFVSALFLLTFLLPLPLGLAGDWVQGWWGNVRGDLRSAEVLHDKYLGRIVIRGELGFGTYQKLEQALQLKPKLTLLQVESPGGYVVEGLAMAKLVERVGLDTVSLEHCASACTFLLAAGRDRYLGPTTAVGFHRSWSYGTRFVAGWTSTDHEIADYYRSRSASNDFVTHALDTPGNRLWVPTHREMLTAGYATHLWADRKFGY